MTSHWRRYQELGGLHDPGDCDECGLSPASCRATWTAAKEPCCDLCTHDG